MRQEMRERCLSPHSAPVPHRHFGLLSTLGSVVPRLFAPSLSADVAGQVVVRGQTTAVNEREDTDPLPPTSNPQHLSFHDSSLFIPHPSLIFSPTPPPSLSPSSPYPLDHSASVPLFSSFSLFLFAPAFSYPLAITSLFHSVLSSRR